MMLTVNVHFLAFMATDNISLYAKFHHKHATNTTRTNRPNQNL